MAMLSRVDLSQPIELTVRQDLPGNVEPRGFVGRQAGGFGLSRLLLRLCAGAAKRRSPVSRGWLG